MESRRVANLMGISELILWENSDSNLEFSVKNVTRLTSLLDHFSPKYIFAPQVNDQHRDHITTNKILAQSLQKSQLDPHEVMILGYEVWGLLQPNCISQITQQFDRKVEYIMQYRIAMKAYNYKMFCEQLNAFRSVSQLNEPGFAEAFFCLTADRYLQLTKDSFDDKL
jgi:LmbE family N-acetylglucosaminyl deacetylase